MTHIKVNKNIKHFFSVKCLLQTTLISMVFLTETFVYEMYYILYLLEKCHKQTDRIANLRNFQCAGLKMNVIDILFSIFLSNFTSTCAYILIQFENISVYYNSTIYIFFKFSSHFFNFPVFFSFSIVPFFFVYIFSSNFSFHFLLFFQLPC